MQLVLILMQFKSQTLRYGISEKVGKENISEQVEKKEKISEQVEKKKENISEQVEKKENISEQVEKTENISEQVEKKENISEQTTFTASPPMALVQGKHLQGS